MDNPQFYIRNYHTIRFTYDSLNRVQSVTYLDEEDRPVDATADLDSDTGVTIPCNKVEFEYTGKVPTRERIYSIQYQHAPIIRDCLRQVTVSTTGQARQVPDRP